MEAELIKEKIDSYKTRKLSWLELAAILDQEIKNGRDYRFFISLGLSEKIYTTMVRAYRFLSVRRLLDHDIKGAYEAIGLLPATYRRLKSSISESDFEKIVADVLSGKITTKKLSMLGRGLIERKKSVIDQSTLRKSFDLFNFIKTLAIKKQGTAAAQKTMLEAYQSLDETFNIDLEQAFGDILSVLDALMQEALEEVTRENLKKKFGTLCHDLAIELECIADEDFLEAQNERESFKL